MEGVVEYLADVPLPLLQFSDASCLRVAVVRVGVAVSA